MTSPTLDSIPRVLWVGLYENGSQLVDLAQSVDEYFNCYGFPRETRSFKAHIALARIKKKPSNGFLKKWEQEKACERNFGEFSAVQVNFYQSRLTKQGAVYSVMRSFELK